VDAVDNDAFDIVFTGNFIFSSFGWYKIVKQYVTSAYITGLFLVLSTAVND